MISIRIQHEIFTSEGPKDLQLAAEAATGSCVCIHGKSGAGKTTFFKILAGLIKPDAGKITARNQVLVDTEQKICLPPQQRNMALMFQHYALFPNMSVKANIAFAQKEKNDLLLNDLLSRFELKALEDTSPKKLSGGQQQRVALARALAQQADILLLDEPLSAVDDAMRKIMTQTISDYQQKNMATVFVISHNKEEIHTLANEFWQL